MIDDIYIRPYAPGDFPILQALESSLTAFRPAGRVAQEFTAALSAEYMEDLCMPFWLALTAGQQAVGCVGVRLFDSPMEMPHWMLLTPWGYVHESALVMRDLKVAPEWDGCGIDTRLCRTAIGWSRHWGYDSLFVNTTSAPAAALELYAELGFRDVARTYRGAFKLVWMKLDLSGCA